MKRKLVVGLLVTCSVLLGACGNNKTEKVNTEVAEEVVNETKNEIETESVEEIEATEVEEIVVDETEVEEVLYTYSDLDKTMYAKQSVNVRDLPSTDGNKLGGLEYSQEVKVTGQCNETSWYRIEYQDGIAYVSNNYLLDEKPVEQVSTGGVATDTAGDVVAQTPASSGDGTVNYNGFVFSADSSADNLALSQTLVNAGYYNPIIWSNGCYYMIVPAGEQEAGVYFIIEWLNGQGLTCNSVGASYFDNYAIAEIIVVQDTIPIQ